MILCDLALSLRMLFERTRDLDVAERAITMAESAVKIANPQEDWESMEEGSNILVVVLWRRFEQTKNTEDLDRIIGVLTDKLPLIPKDKTNYIVNLGCLLHMLAILLPLRAQHTGVLSDLDNAIDYGQQALDLTGQRRDPERVIRLAVLSTCLDLRFKMGSKNLQDIQQAIDLNRQAAEAVDHDDVMRMRVTLAKALSGLLMQKYKYEQDGKVEDLDEAIKVLRQALQGGLSDPERGDLEFNLGHALLERSRHTGDTTNLAKSREAFQRAWACQNAPLAVRIDAAIRAGELAATWAESLKRLNSPDLSMLLEDLWTEVSTDLDNAVSFLHAVSPRHMQNVNKQERLKKFAGVGAAAAAAALNARKEASYALQQLELGRGIISGLVLDLRADLSFLREEHREWADELSKLRNILDSGPDTLVTLPPMGGSRESGAQTRRQAVKDLESLLTKIRSEKGFEQFLMPPTVEQLMEAADPDPAVVVNVSSLRCDAFIVEKHRIRLLELPLLSQEDIHANVKRLKDGPDSLPSVLEWLWSSAVHPILDALGFDRLLSLQDDSWPHIWWIPVGPLSSLPLHAAGYHTRHSGETALDRVMSSYSLSLKSLLAGRRQRKPQYDSGPINALLVSMKSTPHRSPLRHAEVEVDMLEKLCPALNATAIRPVQHKEDILTQLSQCDIFHFAGHGTSDASDPSRSALLLRDWEENPLTVEELRNKKLQEKPPFLAYLSACSTGANEVLELVDEGIHLGYACQLAGFRHVVGTLWAVSDPVCADVARKFYETIRDEGKTDAAVYRGLHRALRESRDGQVGANTRGSGTDATKARALDDKGNEIAVPRGEALNDGGHTAQRSGPRKGEGVGYEPKPSMESLWVPFVHFGV
ncbi:CHAT domain-containing protein [Chaetomium sp. MPI-SDFR-AT-0129]|nr:CHAT domain-containing protein [Chaetomium sp. MPI-SDFR-AT-0129]